MKTKNSDAQPPPSNTRAVALRYDGKGAPSLVAKGQGVVAEQILALAREHDVPMHEDTELVRVLATLELGDDIPFELYVAVAEVLSFAYLISGKSVPDKPGDGMDEP